MMADFLIVLALENALVHLLHERAGVDLYFTRPSFTAEMGFEDEMMRIMSSQPGLRSSRVKSVV